jgi:hypothetical protein
MHHLVCCYVRQFYVQSQQTGLCRAHIEKRTTHLLTVIKRAEKRTKRSGASQYDSEMLALVSSLYFVEVFQALHTKQRHQNHTEMRERFSGFLTLLAQQLWADLEQHLLAQQQEKPCLLIRQSSDTAPLLVQDTDRYLQPWAIIEPSLRAHDGAFYKPPSSSLETRWLHPVENCEQYAQYAYKLWWHERLNNEDRCLSQGGLAPTATGGNNCTLCHYIAFHEGTFSFYDMLKRYHCGRGNGKTLDLQLCRHATTQSLCAFYMLQVNKILCKLSLLFPLLPLSITLAEGQQQQELPRPSLFAMLDLLQLLSTVSDLIHRTEMADAMLRLITRCGGGDRDNSVHFDLAMETVLLKLLIRACAEQRAGIEHYCLYRLQAQRPGQKPEEAKTTVVYGAQEEVRENSLYVNVMLNLRQIHGHYKQLLHRRLTKDGIY